MWRGCRERCGPGADVDARPRGRWHISPRLQGRERALWLGRVPADRGVVDEPLEGFALDVLPVAFHHNLNMAAGDELRDAPPAEAQDFRGLLDLQAHGDR